VHNGVADFQLILKVVFCELLDDFLDVFLEAIAAVISDLDELFGRLLQNTIPSLPIA
jgi:hypothetical protein